MNNEINKKKRYWIIPVLVFATMITSKLAQFILRMFEYKTEFTNTLFNTIFYICGFAVIPSIILVIVLNTKNK